MVDNIALRLQEENRQLRKLITEMQAILDDAILHSREDWDDEVRAAIARAEALGITL